ncbi:MAG: AMP-binding protein [Bacteroidales bacterium]|nr:AMP-binding protein [Bacteroidales bacterium]
MKSWVSHTLIVNGISHHPEKQCADVNSGSDLLVRQVIQFYNEWINDSDLISLQTSGTTGPPKTILVSKQAMMESAIATIKHLGLKCGMKALLCLSPDFIAGKMMIVRAMVSGMNLITTDVSANPVENLAQPIDFTALVPLQVSHILKQSPEKFKIIDQLIIGGSAIDSSLEEALQGIETKCFHTYGMTETLSHIALRPINGIDRTDWFTPFENIELSLDNRGCLTILAPFIQQTPILTNDLAILDERKFKIIGRIDDVIVSAGRKIHPEIVERKIRHLFNKAFIISSLKNESAGEIIVLYCEENHGIKSLYQLWNQLLVVLEAHEMPRQIIPVKQIPYLANGKLDRKAIGRYKL